MKKTILLTGSESFVASFLIKRLKKRYNVIGIDLKKKSNNTQFKVDITNKNSFKIFNKKKIDYIIHLGSISRHQDCTKDVIKCFKTNVIGTLNLIELANTKKIKNFVFASSQWVYDFLKNNKVKDNKSFINIQKIESEYALSKLVSEINLKQNYEKNKINSTILRFGIIYGPRLYNLSAFESIVYKLLDQNKIEIGSKKTGRNFIHIEDICDGITKSIGCKGYKVINLEGEKFISLENLIKKTSQILNKKVTIIEKFPKTPDIKIISNQSAKKDLYWRPKFSLEKGIKNLIEYKKNFFKNKI